MNNLDKCNGIDAKISGIYNKIIGENNSYLTPDWKYNNNVRNGIILNNILTKGSIKYFFDDSSFYGFTSREIPIKTNIITLLKGNQICYPMNVTEYQPYYLLRWDKESLLSGRKMPILSPLTKQIWNIYRVLQKNETDGSKSLLVQYELNPELNYTKAVTSAISNSQIDNRNTKLVTAALDTAVSPALLKAIENSKLKSSGVSTPTVIGLTESGIPIVEELPTPDNGGMHNIGAGSTIKTNDIAKALLLLPTAKEIIDAADQLHGESFASFKTVEIESLSRFSMSVLDTCRKSASQINKDWRICLSGKYTSASVDSGEGIGGFEYQISEFPLTLEYQLDPNWIIGLAGSYGTINQNKHSFQEFDITSETYSALGLAKYTNSHGWSAHLMIGGTNFKNSSTRNVSILNRTATADWTSSGFTTRAGGSYTWAITPVFGVKPYASFTYNSINTPSFTETGSGDANLKVYNHNTTSIRSELGGEFFGVIQIDDDNQLIPQLRMGYLNDASGSQEREIDTSFKNISNSKTSILGRTLGSNAFVLEAAAEIRSGDISLFVNCGGQWWENGDEWSIGGGFRWIL